MDRMEATAAPRHTHKQRLAWLLGAAALVAFGLTIRYSLPADQASAQAPASQSAPAGQPSNRNQFVPQQQAASPAAKGAKSGSGITPEKLPVMAVVNTKQITRAQLAQACVERFGKPVLESLINKYLIAQHLKQQNVSVTRGEIDEEIDRMAKRFRLGTEQWLQMLERERGVNYEQYSRDIIWPTLALRKLAADRLHVTKEDLQQAHDTEYGPAVQARLIAVKDVQTAEKLRAQVLARPDDFGKVARENSVDAVSASAGGMLQPIRLHTSAPNIEQVLFNMKAGEISPVIKVGEQFGIFKCERHIARRNVPLDGVREQLVEKIKEEKLKLVSAEVFEQVQEGAQVVNVLNDPQRRQQMPGVAATVNGHPVAMDELAEECLLRHGRDVLEGEINRQLLEQELGRKNVQVTQQEIDAEIANAAILAGVIDEKTGEPDLQKWVETVTQQQEITPELYIRDAVWPSAALKKMVQKEVEVTQEDMQKGFEANYGERVRCRAIVMSNLRRAQEVWNMARQNPDAEFFGKLAQQYSIEGSSGQLDGQVPPIRKHSGQTLLEKEAFAMQPGEISGVIQVGDKFVILFCEGYTDPVQVNFAEVEDLIRRDIFEKKVRLAMGDRFEKLREQATIDNFLAGTSQTPESRKPAIGPAQPGSEIEPSVRAGVIPASATESPVQRTAQPPRAVQPR